MGILFIGGMLFFVIGQCILAMRSVQRWLSRFDGAKIDNSVDLTLNQMFVDAGVPSCADRAEYVGAKHAHRDILSKP